MAKETLIQCSSLLSLSETLASPELLLTPLVCPEVKEFLAEKTLLFDLVDGLGSPLNIIFPDLLPANVCAFQSILDGLNLPGKIFFAHKANRSDSVVKRLSLENVNIDVASEGELKHALSYGFTADRIEATGPKNRDFIALALAHNIVLNVDSIAELKLLITLKQNIYRHNKVPLLLRICNADTAGKKSSRFGINCDEIEQAMALIGQYADLVQLKGFAFHLDTVSVAEKCATIDYCLDLFEQAYALGLNPDVLNIGGGFKLNYLASQSQWHNYSSALREAIVGKRPPITWHGNSFGLRAEKQNIRGNFASYNYYDAVTGPKFLQELLQQPLPNHNDMPVAQFLRNNGIKLWLEPGRSMLDQVGITVGVVNSCKHSSQKENLVCLDMKRQDLCFLDQEYFVDPIFLSRHNLPERDTPKHKIPIYLAGNLCLESDLIYRHQIFVEHMPQSGDLVVFPNTAAYFMDFSACEAIMQPTASKVAVSKHGKHFAWASDNKYRAWSLIEPGEENDC